MESKLALVFPVESPPRILFVDAHDEQDEQRVLDWLAASRSLLDGADALLGLLDELLDQRETEP
jgi:hypothetical protein